MKRTRVVLDAQEVRRLMEACNKGASGWRNRALIATGFGTGLRLAELLALMPYDLRPGTAHVRNGKGGKERMAPLDQVVVAALSQWHERRNFREREAYSEGKPWPSTAPLFCTLSGRPLHQQYVRAMLARLGLEILGRHVHPHALRHSFAFDHANQGTELHKLRRLLGHSHLNTTGIYVDHLGAGDLAEAAQARTW